MQLRLLSSANDIDLTSVDNAISALLGFHRRGAAVEWVPDESLKTAQQPEAWCTAAYCLPRPAFSWLVLLLISCLLCWLQPHAQHHLLALSRSFCIHPQFAVQVQCLVLVEALLCTLCLLELPRLLCLQLLLLVLCQPEVAWLELFFYSVCWSHPPRLGPCELTQEAVCQLAGLRPHAVLLERRQSSPG